MITISARTDVRKLEKWLTGIRKKQLPFATSVALNKTAGRIRDGLMTEILRKLDRPTPFTMNAFQITRSNKRNLTAWIKLKRIQAQYLYAQIYGGTETALHLVPGRKARLNQYGNLPRGVSKSKGVFSIPGDRKNIYKRTGRGGNKIIRVGHFSTSRSYQKRFDFEGVVARRFDKWFPFEFDRAFALAMLTAR